MKRLIPVVFSAVRVSVVIAVFSCQRKIYGNEAYSLDLNGEDPRLLRMRLDLSVLPCMAEEFSSLMGLISRQQTDEPATPRVIRPLFSGTGRKGD